MHAVVVHRRRVLARAVHAYVAADLAWRAAAGAARHWFPPGERPQTPPIGDPGSRVRRLHDARGRALLRLIVAREKLEVARQRAAARSRPPRLLVRI